MTCNFEKLSKMSKKLTVLITSTDGVGHFNACIGFAEQLRDRGHHVVFAVPDSWKNKLSPMGFTEEWLNPDSSSKTDAGDKLELFAEMARKMAPVFQMTPEERIEHFCLVLWKILFKEAEDNEPRLKEIVAKVKPDVIVADLAAQQPAVMDSGIPWILSMSVAPLGISNENVPLAMLGLPTSKKHKSAWDNCMEIYKSVFKDVLQNFQSWVTANGGPELKHTHLPYILNYSPYANIYMYPKELDYTDLRPNPPNFHRFDTFVRTSNETFEIPEKLQSMPGKLVYFSMGTIGSSELNMMRRLVAIFAKSPNRFIVSKGPQATKFELSDNMWGAASVPQINVIPMVDLVITHGGNNTLTETFYFGKPVLILPLFGDQVDNAQRLLETGFGLRLHPYKSTETELLQAIEDLLTNENIAAKMSAISKRIQASNNLPRVANLIEHVATMKIPLSNRK